MGSWLLLDVNNVARGNKADVHIMFLTSKWVLTVFFFMYHTAYSSPSQEADAHIQTTEDC